MYNADKLTSIDLGRQGENLARTVEIDVSSMLAQWPDAVITLLVKRKHDAEPYIADTTVKDGVLFWPITTVETADAGDGKLEIRATCGEVIAKSATGTFRVTASLTGSGTEPPASEQGWVDKVIAAGGTGFGLLRMDMQWRTQPCYIQCMIQANAKLMCLPMQNTVAMRLDAGSSGNIEVQTCLTRKPWL